MTEYSNMPIFAMRGNFFFPNVRAKVEIAREISRNAFRFGIDHGRKIFLVSQIDPDRADVPAETDLYTVGVIANITSIGSATAEKFEIMVSTLEAARITRFNASPDLLLADVLQRDADHTLLAVFNDLIALDVALGKKNLGDRALHVGCRDVHRLVLCVVRISDAGEHICNYV